MTPNRTILKWSFVIFLFSLLTHLPGITNPILDQHAWAQTLRAALARNYAEGGMRLFHPESDYIETASHDRAPQFPLYSYLVAVLYRLFGIKDFLGRVLSAFFAALSAVYLYFLVRGFEEERLARADAFLFCVVPLRIYFMRAFMPESMAIFSLLGGFYHFFAWVRREKFLPHGLLAAFLLTLVPLLKIAYSPLLLAPMIYLYREKKALFFSAEVLLSSLWIAGAAVSWYLYANFGVEKTEGFAHQMTGEMSVFQEWFRPGFWATHFLSRFPELITTYGGLLFFFVGVRKFWMSGKTFWLLWLGMTVLYIALCGSYGRIHVYASLPFTPVVAVIMAKGAVEIFQSWRGRSALLVLWFILIFSIPVHASLRIRHWYRLDETWVLHAREVADGLAGPGDLFFINSQDQPFYLYHLHRKGYTAHLEGEGLNVLKEAIGHGAKFMFSPNHLTTMNWESVEPEITKPYPLLYRDGNFSIYDLRGAKIAEN